MKKQNVEPLVLKDYAWIAGFTAVIIAMIPLIAAFGLLFQAAFVVLAPVVVVGTIVHALFFEKK